MTNLDHYKETLTKEQFINLMTMNCRLCPIFKETAEQCYAISRTDCMNRLEVWCNAKWQQKKASKTN